MSTLTQDTSHSHEPLLPPFPGRSGLETGKAWFSPLLGLPQRHELSGDAVDAFLSLLSGSLSEGAGTGHQLRADTCVSF